MFGKKKNEDDSEKLMKVSADNLTMITIGTIVKGTITIAGGNVRGRYYLQRESCDWSTRKSQGKCEL